MLAAMLKRARSLPNSPGVYLLKDANGVVLYVGKALRLPDRVSSYFIPSADLGPRKAPLTGLVRDIDHIECETEWEALLAENRLIKDIQPRFNEAMTDGRSYPYLVITQADDFPRVAVTRDPDEITMKGSRVFGPFVAVGALREAVQMLQNVFKYRTCTLDIVANDPKNRFFRPCLLYAINQCSGPCADKITQEAYRNDIDRFTRFLTSKRSVMLRELRTEMDAASRDTHYEKAAQLRDQIRAIEKLDHRAKKTDGWQPEMEIQRIDPRKSLKSLQKTLDLADPIRCIEGIDIAHLQGGETVGSKVCFVDGKPFKSEYRKYKIKAVPGGNDDYASIREVVMRRYREAGAGNELYPDVILIDGGLGQLHAAMDVFHELDIKPPMVISLAKKEELIYTQSRTGPIRLGRENLGLRLVQAVRDEAHRFAQHYHHTLRKKKTLGESEQTNAKHP